jgi:hypothetical protein
MDKNLNEGQKELLEWYDDMPKDAFTNPHGETNLAFPVGDATPHIEIDNPSVSDTGTENPKMEVEIRPKEDGETDASKEDIKDIESWAELHKAKAFAKAMLAKLDCISGDSPSNKDEEIKKKFKNEIKVLSTKIVEIVNNIK